MTDDASIRDQLNRIIDIQAEVRRAELELTLANQDLKVAERYLDQMLADRAARGTAILTLEEQGLAQSSGGIIPAIKAVRARLNIGLKEAKDLVDDYRTKCGAF
jgi:ribosomal protein L7/L12